MHEDELSEQTREKWSRQRISQWRIGLFHDLLVWTLQSPHRLSLQPQLSLILHEVCYTKQREPVANKSPDQKYCRLCVRRGREPWHPLEDFTTEGTRVLKY
jgi:hypothetical protein